MHKYITRVAAAGLLLAAATQAGAQKPKKWYDTMKLSGFTTMSYQYSSQEGSKSNSFALNMVRVGLDGKVGEFYWKTQIQINGNTSTLGSSPRLVDAFAEWQKHREFYVRAGEFQVPFTLESPIHPVDVGFLNNSQAVVKFTGYSDRSGMHGSNGRDIGIMVQGDVLPNASGRPLLHYAASVVNGQGIGLSDVDQRKNLVGCLWVMPVEGMRIGLSGWEGSYARKGTWTAADGSAQSGVRSLPQHRYAISADYQDKGFTARTEYVHSTGEAFAKTLVNTNDASASDCSLSKLGNKADGFYALAIAPVVKEKVNVKARYDVYRNQATWGSAKSLYEAGVDFFPAKKLRLSAEYCFVNDRTLSGKHDYSQVFTQLSVKF